MSQFEAMKRVLVKNGIRKSLSENLPLNDAIKIVASNKVQEVGRTERSKLLWAEAYMDCVKSTNIGVYTLNQ